MSWGILFTFFTYSLLSFLKLYMYVRPFQFFSIVYVFMTYFSTLERESGIRDEYLSLKHISGVPTNLTLSVLQINARSILDAENTRLDEIELLLTDLPRRPEIILVSETWLTPHNDFLCNLSGYDFLSNPRGSRGGGVGIFICTDLTYVRTYPLEISDAMISESLFIEVVWHSSKILVGSFYRPPAGKFDPFIQYMSSLTHYISNYANVVFGGDFNINLLANDNHSNTLRCHMSEMGLSNIFLAPTRVTGGVSTCIDNIYCSFDMIISHEDILVSDISDHYPLLVSLEIGGQITLPNSILPPTFHNDPPHIVNWNAVSVSLSAETGLVVDDLTRCESIDTILLSFLKIVYSKFFVGTSSFVTRRIGPRASTCYSKPWMNPVLVRLSRIKNLLFKRYKFGHSPSTLAEYLKAKKLFNTSFKDARCRYFSTLFAKTSSDPRKLWRSINFALNGKPRTYIGVNHLYIDSCLIDDPMTIATAFNDYFASVPVKLASRFTDSLNSDTILGYMHSCADDMNFDPLTMLELDGIISRLKQGTKPDSLGFSSHLLKRIYPIIKTCLLFIINTSFSSGVFPAILKHSVVTPVFKSGNRGSMGDYRPISILPALSKIFEMSFLLRLDCHLVKFSVLCKEQFGFRVNHSTDLALLSFVEDTLTVLDSSQYRVSVFLDLSKAFDTIDLDILLLKLTHYGIRGLPYDWIKSFLCHRFQSTKISGSSSDKRVINLGVPQGSILGPVLFLIYINDIVNSSPDLRFNLYADDTVISCSGTDLEQVFGLLNGAMGLVDVWLKVNRLTLNTSKSNYVLFHNRRPNALIPPFDLTIGSGVIERVRVVKYLGVLIDERLTWIPHLGRLRTILSRSVAVIRRLSRTIPFSALKLTYYAIFHSYINYASVVWGNSSPNILRSVVALQYRCITLINSRRPFANDNVHPLCPDTISAIFLRQLIIIFYKYSHNSIPLLLQQHFNNFLIASESRYHTRFSHIPRLPRIYTEQGRHSIIYSIILNFDLCSSFLGIRSLSAVKQKLRASLN
jgi:hypothetical protein